MTRLKSFRFRNLLLFDFEGLSSKKEYNPSVRWMQNGGVAQLGEHLPCKQGVMGSNPIISTKGEKMEKRIHR